MLVWHNLQVLVASASPHRSPGWHLSLQMTIPALCHPQQMLHAQHCSLHRAHLRICEDPLIKRTMGRVFCANEAPVLGAVAPPTREAEHKSSLKGLCSVPAWRNFLKTSQPINQTEKQAKKILQRSVWWTNTSETILGLIGEVLTAAVQIGVMTLHFLLSHHITGSLEATVAGVHVVKIFQWFHQIFTSKNLWQDNSHQNKKKELWEVSFCWGLVWFVCLLFPQCSLNLKIRLFSEILRDFFF